MTPVDTAARVLSAAFGVLTVLAAVGPAHRAPATAILLAAVGCAVLSRPAATAVVVLAVGAVVLTGPPPAQAVLCGLCATVYLLTRHGVATLTASSAAAAGGAAAVGLLFLAVPLSLPWTPLLAAPAVVAAYAAVAAPFAAAERR